MKKELNFFDNPRNVTWFMRVFFGSLIVLLIIDFFIEKHPYFTWEGATDFYAVYGFLACVGLVFVAKLMRLFIKRNENYYDD